MKKRGRPKKVKEATAQTSNNKKNEIAIKNIPEVAPEILNKLILEGNLLGMSDEQKVVYYRAMCDRVGLDPATKPFDIIKMPRQNKEILYATRECSAQLSKKYSVSHQITSREEKDGYYYVTCRASLPSGRFTESIGVVSIKDLQGDMYSNSIMKADTKAKRRATLDLLGLGILDESELDTIDSKPNYIEPKMIEPKKALEPVPQYPPNSTGLAETGVKPQKQASLPKEPETPKNEQLEANNPLFFILNVEYLGDKSGKKVAKITHQTGDIVWTYDMGIAAMLEKKNADGIPYECVKFHDVNNIIFLDGVK